MVALAQVAHEVAPKPSVENYVYVAWLLAAIEGNDWRDEQIAMASSDPSKPHTAVYIEQSAAAARQVLADHGRPNPSNFEIVNLMRQMFGVKATILYGANGWHTYRVTDDLWLEPIISSFEDDTSLFQRARRLLRSTYEFPPE